MHSASHIHYRYKQSALRAKAYRFHLLVDPFGGHMQNVKMYDPSSVRDYSCT